jgi:hypothetical protein
VHTPSNFKLEITKYTYEDDSLTKSDWMNMNISSDYNFVSMETLYNGTTMYMTLNGTDGSAVIYYLGMCMNTTAKIFDVDTTIGEFHI